MTSQAVIVFNDRKQALTNMMERLNVEPVCCAQDNLRIKRAAAKEAEVAKSKRKKRMVTEKSAEEGVHDESLLSPSLRNDDSVSPEQRTIVDSELLLPILVGLQFWVVRVLPSVSITLAIMLSV